MNAPAKKTDRRGAPAGDPAKPHGRKREGTPHEGKMGNLKHEVTEENQQFVKTHVAMGTPQETIAYLLKISVDTLTRHYRPELDHGLWEANAAVGGQLFHLTQGRRPNPTDPTKVEAVEAAVQQRAIQFWQSRRGGPGWRERQQVDHSLAVGTGEEAPPQIADEAAVGPVRFLIEFVPPKPLPEPAPEKKPKGD